MLAVHLIHIMNSIIFTVHPKKAAGIYEIKDDNTSIDNFVIKLKHEVKDLLLEISVKGLSAGKDDFTFKQLPYGFEQKHIYWNPVFQEHVYSRKYYLKLYIDFDKFPFKICNMAWTPLVDRNLQKGSEADFYYNRDRAFVLLEDFLKKHSKCFLLSVFCGILPGSSWPNRCYIKLIIKLPVSGIDLFTHAGINNLTEFGLYRGNEIKLESAKIVDTEKINLENLFQNKKARESIVRRAENIIRKKEGLKHVGDAYVNETVLAKMTLKLFPDTIRQYNPQWLGNFIIDLYIPSLNIAVEYQGEQHYYPIKRFGGEGKLLKQQERDNFVRMKCQEFNVVLLEWHYTLKVTEQNVYQFYSQYIDLNNYKRLNDII